MRFVVGLRYVARNPGNSLRSPINSDVFASLAPPRNIRTSLLIYCQFQQSDLEFFERVLQLAVQLCNDGRLLLAFLLFLQHFDVEIVHFHTMTLNHTLYVVHNSGWTSGALFSNFIIFS